MIFSPKVRINRRSKSQIPYTNLVINSDYEIPNNYYYFNRLVIYYRLLSYYHLLTFHKLQGMIEYEFQIPYSKSQILNTNKKCIILQSVNT